MNTREILLRAADLIEKRGLHKGWYVGPGGCLCTAGALFAALGIEPKPEPERGPWPGQTEALMTQAHDTWSVFSRFLATRGIRVGVPVWNDAESRTADEVVAKLREAAEATS